MPAFARSPAHRLARPSTIAVGVLAVLGACAWFTRQKTREAEALHPPAGHFVDVDAVRLHYTEHGQATAPPVVLLHGNGAMSTEMELSGLVERLTPRYRVIVFDRPGYGYSERPSGHSFTPEAQAELLLGALDRLGVSRPIMLGHSWGALVATAMGAAAPDRLRGLVLVSGYYTPGLRLDVGWMSAPATPLLGTLLRHTVAPLLARLLWPAMVRRIFSPAPTAPAFAHRYPVWMSLRPRALRASAAEAAMMIPQAARLRRRESALQLPIAIVAGAQDRLVSTAWHSGHLHRRLPGSQLYVVPDAGHMVHHTSPEAVVAALDELVDKAPVASSEPSLSGSASEPATVPLPTA